MRRMILTAMLFAVAVFAVPVATASASGKSNLNNGCYAQWGDTGVSGYCHPATATGMYRVHVDCTAPEIPDYDSDYYPINRGDRVDHFGQIDCAYGIHSARIEYTVY